MDRVELELNICWKILEIRKEFPNLRVGQILSNCLPENTNDPFYIEDERLLEGLTSFLEKCRLHRKELCAK